MGEKICDVDYSGDLRIVEQAKLREIRPGLRIGSFTF
jgi:hypothetical protein